MKRIGVFGGAFNPVHTAHLIIAEDVRQQMHLNKVLFIPYAKPPHKEHGELSDAEIRLHMINLAISDNPFFESSDMEIKRGKNSVTYTVDTLLELREQYKNEQVKLYLIIGIDNLIDLHTWKDPGKLFLLSEVVVLNRPGYLIQNVQNDYNRQVIFIPAPNLDISATDIRFKIKENKSIKYLVPKAVEEFIKNNKLYLQD
jgi:nicotinate-nucleotide adenylyltransferase